MDSAFQLEDSVVDNAKREVCFIACADKAKSAAKKVGGAARFFFVALAPVSRDGSGARAAALALRCIDIRMKSSRRERIFSNGAEWPASAKMSRVHRPPLPPPH
jgi:hypothetical protein